MIIGMIKGIRQKIGCQGKQDVEAHAVRWGRYAKLSVRLVSAAVGGGGCGP
jgi:hypothetical protein